jgi:hypothetical protein
MVCAPNPAPTGPRRHLVCTGATEPRPEHCDGLDEDCDGVVDNGVTVAGCYTGATGTLGIGVCHPGVQACVAGQPGGACTGQVTPSDEQCNGRDDNCNGAVDDAPGGGVITTTCYEGPPGTRSVGTCVAGTATCAFGTFGACAGQVTPTVLDICGDGLDTDCDGSNDAAEGCLALGAERRLDVTGGGVGEIGDATSGTEHAYDVVLAAGFGSKVYAAWSQLVSGRTEVYFRSSTDGGTTWSPIINLTSSVNRSAVKPAIAVAPGATGATDRIVVVYQTVNTGVRDIHVQISTDGGASFGASSATLDAAGDSFHHVVAIRGSNCVVAWEKLDTATLNRDIQSRTSSDGCSTFNTETKINVGTGIRFAGRPQVGLTAAGVVWAWREQRPPATTRDIFAAASATLTAAPAESAVDTDTTNESDFPVLRVNQTSAYLVWQEVSTVSNTPGSGSDVLFARSINGGATWSATRIIDDPAGEVSGSFTPSLAIDPKADVTTDVVAIAWEDRRQGTQVFTSVSSDGGATFATPVRASSNATAPIVGQTSAPQIAAAGGGVLAVAYQNQLTSGVPHVFIATSIDTGVTWTYSALRIDGGLGSALAPQIIAAKTPVPSKPAAVTAWADFRSDQVQGDIYVAVSH